MKLRFDFSRKDEAGNLLLSLASPGIPPNTLRTRATLRAHAAPRARCTLPVASNAEVGTSLPSPKALRCLPA